MCRLYSLLVVLVIGLSVGPPGRGAAAPTPAPDAPKSPGPSVLERAFPLIEGLYLHPEAADPKEMLRAGLQALEDVGPEVLVTEEGDLLTLHAGGETKSFNIQDAQGTARTSSLLKEAVAWVSARRGANPSVVPGGLEALALRGAIEVIDRHSQVITGDGLEDFNTRFEGTLVGIGARIGRRGKELLVLRPFPGTPAERAGLLPNDVVSRIDGYPADALATEDAVDRIRGPAGVPVVLSVLRPGEGGPRAFVIVREKVIAPSVESERIVGDIGLFYIDHFSKETSSEFDAHLREMQGEKPLAGLILDLRDNQGGSMIHSARIVNTFVDEGILVRTEGRNGETVEGLTPSVRADPGAKRYDGPLAVLINGRTASGAEIVAGGLKVLGRSITIGSQSFGKGTVQKVFPLADDVQLKLTVARYLVPDDVFINQVGVTPDIATGQVWLDPEDPTLPDSFLEPPVYEGRAEGRGGLDARRRPGSGRAPSREGTQAAPELNLWYPRVLPGWRPGESVATPVAEGDGPPPPDPGLGISTAPGDAGEPRWNDVELALAWSILSRGTARDRRAELLAISRDLVGAEVTRQAVRMEEAAALRQIRWTASSPTEWLRRAPGLAEATETALLDAPPSLPIRLELPPALSAGDRAEVRLSVENTTGRPLRHVRASLRSSSSALDNTGFLLGDLEPGEGRSVAVVVQPAESATSRLDPWRLYLLDDRGPLGGPVQGSVATRGAETPVLDVALTSAAVQDGNGSRISMATKVRNTGTTPTGEIRVRFGAPPDPGVDRLERFKSIPSLAAGESAEVTLTVLVRPLAGAGQRPIPLIVSDSRSGSATEVEVDLGTIDGRPTAWRTPAVVDLAQPDPRPASAPARSRSSFRVQGRVRSPGGLDAVEVFVGADKVFAQGPGSKKPGQAVEFDVPVQLHVGPNRVTVRTRTHTGVRRSTLSWVLGELDEASASSP